MTADIKALVDQIFLKVQSAYAHAERPRYAAEDNKDALALLRELRPILTAQAEEIERLRGEPTDAQVEAAARTIHGMFYGYEGANPNSGPDDEDRAIARAALKAAQEAKA